MHERNIIGIVVAIPLFLLFPIILNYRKECRYRRMYKMYENIIDNIVV